ncbi:ethanolamine ammonia-lyase subunit EutC [Desulfosporosinus sp. BICA1-9]|uniref:ethanolamine ammonia-lyase subunit EutC n=1 Tax=Desulfosporosinus sp. BICA1-9 TaxID=1531958 RepID=UPI00054C23F0|nr:ethanolamine ammonia-lyase subunit EutC [Desulfosporosinus sp. BICA1-9]KJS49284.1 MAG: ethanolamine ammonia-lyase [Peptococcaceae bacterium BRH_c23]KJS81193.1 MAG: ethanolamine ammonia-lyase [Desulfosporosinus sp. BICA1-9]HBW37536.1 ethanolamine ammonia-lyase subunit EutC [Desulfosporosinus sp.]
MGLEDNVRAIVEELLKDMGKGKSQVSANAPVIQEDALTDLAEIDLQHYLQVPNPVNKALYEEMKLSTPARIGVWRCGPRPLTDTIIRFRADHAVAQDSVLGEVQEDFPAKYNMVSVQSLCQSKDEYLTRPDLGRKLDAENLGIVRKGCQKGAMVQIIVSDGLSSKAVEANIPNLLPALTQGLEGMGVKLGTTIFVQHGRVAMMDMIGEELKPDVAVILIGERPGLGTAESMSAYMGYNPRLGMVESERTVISNIHKGGTPAAEAGAHLASLIKKMLDMKASGVNLE